MKSPKNGAGTSAFPEKTVLYGGWQRSCSWFVVIMTPLSPSGHLQKSEAAVRPRPKNRTKTARRPRKKAPVVDADEEKIRPAVGTLSRTKSLLLAALKVWELKNGIRD
jgi:hypothetical protein